MNALDILNNIEQYTVDRDEKMNRTIDKMCDNHAKKIEQKLQSSKRKIESKRGYGEGRKMGD